MRTHYHACDQFTIRAAFAHHPVTFFNTGPTFRDCLKAIRLASPSLAAALEVPNRSHTARVRSRLLRYDPNVRAVGHRRHVSLG